MQQGLLHRARTFHNRHMVRLNSKQDLYEFFMPRDREQPEALHGGFALCHWSGAPEVETKVKEELQVTIRCIPLDAETEEGCCIMSGQPSRCRVIFAKAYWESA